MTNLKIVHLLSSNAKLEPGKLGAVATVALGLIESSTSNNNSYVCIPDKGGETVQDTIKSKFLRISLNMNFIKKSICKIHPGYRDYLYIKEATKKINDINPDIVIIHNRPGYVVGFRKYLSANIKLVLHEHNNNIAHMFSIRNGKKILSNLDAVFCVSQSCKNIDIIDKHPEYERMTYVVYNGVDTALFNPGAVDTKITSDIKKTYNLLNKKVILFTGAIRERKGLHFLLEAFKEISCIHEDVVLLIAGGSALNEKATDRYAKDIYSQVKSLGGKVIVLGYIPHNQLNQIYSVADIYCAPSKWEEAFGLVFVEAMACGIPVVSTTRGGIPEIVKEGETGYLVDNIENNITTLKEKLLKLIEDDKLIQTMGKSARKAALETFDWKYSAQRLDILLENIIKEVAK